MSGCMGLCRAWGARLRHRWVLEIGFTLTLSITIINDRVLVTIITLLLLLLLAVFVL